jgi:RNA 2',3'-cyclic 3'-phosphodiesterase
MRAFLAFNIGRQAIDTLAQRMCFFHPKQAKITLVKPRDLHITLHFLQDLRDQDLQQLIRTIDKTVIFKNPILSFDLGQIGIFPSRKNPRIVWIGLAGDVRPLMDIQLQLSAILQSHEFTVDNRPFIPHITLCRIKTFNQDYPFLQQLETCVGTIETKVTIDSLILCSSELTADGPKYTVLHSFPFSP